MASCGARPDAAAPYETFLKDRMGWGAGTDGSNLSKKPPSAATEEIDLFIVYIETSSSTDKVRSRVEPASWLDDGLGTGGVGPDAESSLRDFFRANTSGFLELGTIELWEAKAASGSCTGLGLLQEGVQQLWNRSDVDLSSYDRDSDGTVRSDEVLVAVVNNCDPGGRLNRVATGSADGVAYDLAGPFVHNRIGFATFVHEIMHSFGAKDMYVTDGGGVRCRGWCTGMTLMSNTSDKPMLLGAPHRFANGWVVPPVAYMGDISDLGVSDDLGRLTRLNQQVRISPSENSAYLTPGALAVLGSQKDQYFIVEVRVDEVNGASYDLRPAKKRKAGIVAWRVALNGDPKMVSADNNSPALVKTVTGLGDCVKGSNALFNAETEVSSWLPQGSELFIPLTWKDSSGSSVYSGYMLRVSDWNSSEYTGLVELSEVPNPSAVCGG